MQDQIEQDQTTSTTPAGQEEVSAWLDAASDTATQTTTQDRHLHALAAIYGISRVMRRLGTLLEPGEQQALAEAIECLSDEMLEQYQFN